MITERIVVVYMDNILIFIQILKQHVRVVQRFLEILAEYKCYIPTDIYASNADNILIPTDINLRTKDPDPTSLIYGVQITTSTMTNHLEYMKSKYYQIVIFIFKNVVIMYCSPV